MSYKIKLRPLKQTDGSQSNNGENLITCSIDQQSSYDIKRSQNTEIFYCKFADVRIYNKKKLSSSFNLRKATVFSIKQEAEVEDEDPIDLENKSE